MDGGRLESRGPHGVDRWDPGRYHKIVLQSTLGPLGGFRFRRWTWCLTVGLRGRLGFLVLLDLVHIFYVIKFLSRYILVLWLGLRQTPPPVGGCRGSLL